MTFVQVLISFNLFQDVFVSYFVGLLILLISRCFFYFFMQEF
jgi:hypothetical protein